MTKFDPKGKILEVAIAITDPKDAKQYLKAYIDFIQADIDRNPTRKGDNAENIAKGNIGYYAGYYDNEVRARIEQLYSCAHPVFGSIAEKGPPGPKKAFAIGVALGKKMKKETLKKEKADGKFHSGNRSRRGKAGGSKKVGV